MDFSVSAFQKLSIDCRFEGFAVRRKKLEIKLVNNEYSIVQFSAKESAADERSDIFTRNHSKHYSTPDFWHTRKPSETSFIQQSIRFLERNEKKRTKEMANYIKQGTCWDEETFSCIVFPSTSFLFKYKSLHNRWTVPLKRFRLPFFCFPRVSTTCLQFFTFNEL